MAESGQDGAQTFHAPAERAPLATVRAQAGVVAAHPFLTTLLNALPDGLLVLNPQRQIVFANRAAQKLLGDRPLEAIVGLRPGEALGCAHAHEGPGGGGTSPACRLCGTVNAILESQSAAREARQDGRLLCEGAGGPRALDVSVVAAPLALDGATFTLLLLRDRAAEAWRAVLERLFFHDLLNLAGALQGLVRLMTEQPDEISRGLLNRLAHITGRIVAALREQRDLSAAERGELHADLEPVPVGVVMAELEALYATHTAGEGRRIRWLRRTPADQCVRANRSLLLRVLGNLLKNALEATRVGDTVTVEAEPAENGRVQFRVHNPGCMAPEVQAQVFQRSFTTKGEPGRGLGTFSAKLLTERYLGGRIGFTSTERDGTTFTVTLPAVKRVGATETPPEAARLDGASILLADDDPDSRWLGRRMLESAGARVQAVGDGSDVLRAVATGEKFDLVLLDMRMPQMDGLTTVRALRERGYRGVVLALTASGRVSPDVWRASGCDGWLDKALDPEELLTALAEYARGCRPGRYRECVGAAAGDG